GPGNGVDEVPAGLGAAGRERADAADVEAVDETVAAVTAQHLAEPAVSVAADDVEIVMSVDASGPVADTSEPVADASGPAVAIHLGEEPSLTYAGELEPEADPAQRDSLDDLFAKLRAAGTAGVAAAH